MTFNGSTKQSELFINGVSKGTKTHATDFDATPGNFNVGKRSTASDPFDGKIDEAAIYGTILSSARILAHYNAGAGGAAWAQPVADTLSLADATRFDRGLSVRPTRWRSRTR